MVGAECVLASVSIERDDLAALSKKEKGFDSHIYQNMR